MGYGRLIRVAKYQGDPDAVSYVVAVPEPQRAIEIISTKIAHIGDQVEDLGRVSDALIKAMNLEPRGFLRV